MGVDSFTPDSGVLLAKTKNADRAPFIWTVDANPQDIDRPTSCCPTAPPQKMTIGDYRQLSDALFHAGTDSGSEYEYVDQANRLHFYVLDIQRDRAGRAVVHRRVRSLDGAGPQRRGVSCCRRPACRPANGWASCRFPLRNTGRAGPAASTPRTSAPTSGSDVYRLSAEGRRPRLAAWLPNQLATAQFGKTVVAVNAKREAGHRLAKVTLTATSESDPSKTDKATCVALAR